MRYLLWPLQIIYKIYFLCIFSLLLVGLYPVYRYLLNDPKRHRRAFKIMRLHVHVLLKSTGIFTRVKGIENIPASGAYIICPNHSSFLDAFCIYDLFPDYFVFTGKKEIEKWPVFHIFYTSGMNIMVDRGSASGALPALKRMTRELSNGNPLVIFPEGTRSKTAPELAPFKPGAFVLATRMQVPIVPVSFVTNWKRLGRGGILNGNASPGISEVVIHPPVPTKGMTKNDVKELIGKVREVISGPLISRKA